MPNQTQTHALSYALAHALAHALALVRIYKKIPLKKEDFARVHSDFFDRIFLLIRARARARAREGLKMGTDMKCEFCIHNI